MAGLSRVKTWISEVLTAGDLNAEFDNLITTIPTADYTWSGISSFSQILTTTGGIVSGSNIRSDTTNTDTLGTSSVTWADLYLGDGAVAYFGEDQDVSLTHTADTGLHLNAGMKLGFRDLGGEYIYSVADGTLGIVAATELDITTTTVDINGALDVSGNIVSGGEIDAVTLDISGNADIDGIANLDNTDIDGTLAVDGTTISLDATTSLNIDNSNTSNGITIGTATSGVPVSIGHTVSEVTVNDNLTVTGTLTLGSGAELTEAELEILDGITAGVVAANKAVVVNSDKDAASFRNLTLTGELDAATLNISGDADIDGTTNLDAVDIDGAVQLDGTLTIGANDTGYDVILYGDAADANLTWDTSVDDLIWNGAARAVIPDSQLVLGSTAVTTTGAEINLIDGGTSRGTTAVASGDGILINDAGTMRMTNVDTVSTYFSSHNVGGTNIVTVGTIGTGTWQGTAIASAYLDSDTAHLSGTQTFSGAKTFSAAATLATGSTIGNLPFANGSITDSSGSTSMGDENLALTGQLLLGNSTAQTIVSVVPKVQVEGLGYANSSISILNNSNDGIGSHLYIGKSRGTSLSSNTIVQDGDAIGGIHFVAADGTDRASRAAGSFAVVDGTPGANDTPAELLFQTTADGANSPTTRMAIKSNGRVGIGTTAPASLLHLHTTTSMPTALTISNSNADANAAYLKFVKTSASPADNDMAGLIDFYADNDNATPQETRTALIYSQITDVTDGSEDGNLVFKTTVNGSLNETMTIKQGATHGTGLFLGGTYDYNSGYFLHHDHFIQVNGGTSFCGGVITSVDTSTDGTYAGAYAFQNRNNSDAGWTTSKSIASIQGLVETSDSNAGDDSGGHMTFLTKPEAGMIAPRMTILSGGNIGIGTAVPAQLLHLKGTAQPNFKLETTGDNHPHLMISGNRSGENVDTGRLQFQWNGNAIATIAGVSGPSTTPKNDGVMSFQTAATGGAMTERMRINQLGQVGINCEPLDMFHLRVADNINMQFGYPSGTTASIGALTNGEGAYIDMRIDADELHLNSQSGGDVGIGTAAPNAKLHVYSGASGNTTPSFSADDIHIEGTASVGMTMSSNTDGYGLVYFADSGSDSSGYISYWHSNDSMTFGTDTTARMIIDNAGNINIPGLSASSDVQTDGSKNLVTTSDERLKNADGFIENALSTIEQLTPRYFFWKHDVENGVEARQLGFFSQEVHALIPEAAPVENDIWGLNTRALVAYLTAAVQELSAKINKLEN